MTGKYLHSSHNDDGSVGVVIHFRLLECSDVPISKNFSSDLLFFSEITCFYLLHWNGSSLTPCHHSRS